MINTVASNITRARLRRGFTMEDLAQRTNYSKQAISHFENGIRNPDSNALLTIGEALGVDFDFFYSDNNVEFELGEVNYRKGMYMNHTDKIQIQDVIGQKLHSLLELETIAKDYIEFHNPIEDLIIRNAYDAQVAADVLRKKWKLGDGPIFNIASFLEKKGIRMIWVDFYHSINFEGLCGWAESKRIPVIVLNSRQQEITRLRFTILHELGHLLLVMDDKLTGDIIENICDSFAGAVLLPYDILLHEFGKNRTVITMHELRRIKELYGISCTAIMVRAMFTKLISIDAFQKWRNSDFYDRDFGHYNGIEQPQKFLQMLYRCLSEHKIGFDKASKLANIDEVELQSVYNQQIIF